MAENGLMRRTKFTVEFAGIDITKELALYHTALTYTDDSDDMADDLRLDIQDSDGVWMEDWLVQAVAATEQEKLSMSAVIYTENRETDGKLKTGKFELDSVDAGGAEGKVTMKGTSLAFTSGIRDAKKSRAWENYTLSGITKEIAAGGGMGCIYEAPADPSYSRVEQSQESDIDFLKKLCENAGLSIKATDGNIVIYDQLDYEAKPPVLFIHKKKSEKSGYTKYKLASRPMYASCHVRYMNAGKGTCVEATVQDPNVSGSRVLEVSEKAESIAEAETLAKKKLRAANREAKTAVFDLVGNPWLVAGLTVELVGWGGWSGKYIITRAVHKVGSGGYTTQITMRKVLGY